METFLSLLCLTGILLWVSLAIFVLIAIFGSGRFPIEK